MIEMTFKSNCNDTKMGSNPKIKSGEDFSSFYIVKMYKTTTI